MKAKVSDSVVSKVGLPKFRVWGEMARMFIDRTPLPKRRETGVEPLESGEASVLFGFPQKQNPQMQSLCGR